MKIIEDITNLRFRKRYKLVCISEHYESNLQFGCIDFISFCSHWNVNKFKSEKMFEFLAQQERSQVSNLNMETVLDANINF